MIKFNRITEYALIALKHLGGKESSVSAREIAETYQIPFEITAKTLQRLKEGGVVLSTYGTKGGYTLAQGLEKTSLMQLLQILKEFEAVVPCHGNTEHKPPCEYIHSCNLKTAVQKLNGQVAQFLNGINLKTLLFDEAPEALDFHPQKMHETEGRLSETTFLEVLLP